jgi:hypothetical protein
LQQPFIHNNYRSYFNAVDVHNKLCVGPRSVCILGGNHLLLKLWLAMVAIAETNTYLTYAKLKKLSSDQYSHLDCRIDLEQELLRRGQQAGQSAEEEEFPRTRSSTEGVATRVGVGKRMQMPPTFHGHALKRDETKNRKCMVCGTCCKSATYHALAVLGLVALQCMPKEGRWHLHSLADPNPCSHPLSRAPCPGKLLLLSALPCLLSNSCSRSILKSGWEYRSEESFFNLA